MYCDLIFLIKGHINVKWYSSSISCCEQSSHSLIFLGVLLSSGFYLKILRGESNFTNDIPLFSVFENENITRNFVAIFEIVKEFLRWTEL